MSAPAYKVCSCVEEDGVDQNPREVTKMSHKPKIHAVKVGSRWTTVVEYCHHGGSGCRAGFWCPDQLGGWGVGDTRDAALDWSARPYLYRTRKAAIADNFIHGEDT